MPPYQFRTDLPMMDKRPFDELCWDMAAAGLCNPPGRNDFTTSDVWEEAYGQAVFLLGQIMGESDVTYAEAIVRARTHLGLPDRESEPPQPH